MDNPWTIAIIEDEKDIQTLIKEALENQGYAVLTADDGQAAQELIRQTPTLDLIIMDLMLPYVDGLSLMQQIRSSNTVPILILSAKGSDFDKVIGLEHGADDYLAKPFSVVELLARVKSLLRRSHDYNAGRQETLPSQQVFDFTVLAQEYAIEKKGVKIPLTNKEFRLLQHFIDHPHQVFTKYQLYQAIWDEEFLQDDNIINVTVRRLRKKIEEDPANSRYIVTVWGIGYRLGEDR